MAKGNRNGSNGRDTLPKAPNLSNVSNNEFWGSLWDNSLDYQEYFNRLIELSVSMFEWKGLPDTVDPRFLELALFTDGRAVFFRDEVMGYLGMRCNLIGMWDVYNTPLKRQAFASNGYNNSDLDEGNSVVIWNNFLRMNSAGTVMLFAKRLYNLDMAIDVNVNAQKTPIIVRASEKQRLTMKNLYAKYEGNEPFIFADPSIDMNALEVLKTDAPFVAPELYQLKSQIWNEVLTYLGISNINVTKKERMITDEVTRNLGGTVASRYSRLEMRRQACGQINRMFPELHVECDYREDFQELTERIDPLGEDGDGSETSLQEEPFE